jgi:hypothetical protein
MSDAEAPIRHLQRLLDSEALAKSETSRKLITYLFERSVRGETPKETEIAIDVFGRDASFNGAEDSLVRVAVRTLRQKLAEYYAGEGRQDALQFSIPKGAYRLTFTARPPEEPAQPPPDGLTRSSGAAPAARKRSAWAWAAGCAFALLALSLLVNVYLWKRVAAESPAEAAVRRSAVWADIVASKRPALIVLGDLFMYTQTDPKTGRVQTVRDTTINSSEDLRAFLASNPEFAADRGLRYATMIQKSAAIGMASILQIVSRPGRRVEVRVPDEVQAEDVRNYDIIYLGPLVRLGTLAGHYQLRSRYRFNPGQASVTDLMTQNVFLPEGELGAQHKDYALAAKFQGPTGNHILIFTSGGRNAGLLQIVRTLTSPAGLEQFDARLRSMPGGEPRFFEALLSVTGFRQADLAAEVVDVHTLPFSPAARQASFRP